MRIVDKDKNQLFCDRGDYNSNTKLANCYDNVRSVDTKGNVLECDKGDYNTDTKLMHCFDNVKLTDTDANVLLCEEGEYDGVTGLAKFRTNVVLTDKDGGKLVCDHGTYDSNTNLADFYENVKLTKPDGKGELVTSHVIYNTKTEIAKIDTEANIMGADGEFIYTTNGDDPAYTDDSHFTGTKYDGNPLSISATTTVKAIAVSSKGKVSDIVSAVYSIVNTEGHGTVESPFTVADALVVLNALSDVGVTTNYYTKGYVIGDITVSEDGRASFQISDKADAPTGMMNVYMANGLEEGVYTEGDMKAGDEVVICAKMMYYGTSPEFYPGYIYSINGKTSKTTGIQTIIAEKLKNTAVYNLQGVRVDNPQKGLYIINGKKVVVK